MALLRGGRNRPAAPDSVGAGHEPSGHEPACIGPYLLEAKIGVGGMGAVYRAYDTRLERRVAIKRMRASGPAAAAALRRFHREARLVARLSHPAIVHLYDLVPDAEGNEWIVMELIEGRSLAELLHREPLEPERVVVIARQVAEALAEAHGYGIVHRDLKTENVMVTTTDRAKVLDFGLAKELAAGEDTADSASGLTVEGAVLGTCRAMSPEQAQGFAVGASSDLFSLGVLIYETATAERPFLGDTPAASLARVCTFEPPRLDEVDPGLPASLGVLVESLLHKSPVGRPQSAKTVAEALGEILNELRAPRSTPTPRDARPAPRRPAREQTTMVAPESSPKAAIEHVLGWRPAIGQNIPQRPHWVLEERLGKGGFGEVWRAAHRVGGAGGRHRAIGERRIFKFCFEVSRLRALRREVTLFHLLRESLGHRDDIARVLDWNFDAPPFFLEAEFAEGGDLRQWAEQLGGLAAVPLATRIELVAQVATALAAAHSVGVLHKDVKPENVLILPSGTPSDRSRGRTTPRARLTDFGVGALLDRSQLDALGITAQELTGTGSPETGSPETGSPETGLETLAADASTAGSLRYLAPELLEGKPASIQSDLYSVGVLLYQVVVGDFSRSLASGWRREVDDALLIEDLELLVDGAPQRRLESAAALAQRLRGLESRRQEKVAERRARQWLRRRRWMTAAGALAALVLVLFSLQAQRAQREAERLRERAESAREQAEDLISFMLGDLQAQLLAVGRLDGLDGAGRKVVEYFEQLDPNELDARTLARYAKALHQLGDVRMAQGQLDEAIDMFQRALTQTRHLVERDPDNQDALFELGQGHFWVGNVHFEKGDLPAALDEMRAYLEISQQLQEQQPEDERLLSEVTHGHNNVGALLAGLGNTALAREHFVAAAGISRQLAERNPSDAELRRQWVTAQVRLGQSFEVDGELRAAYDSYSDAAAAAEAGHASHPGDTQTTTLLSLAYDYQAGTALYLGDLDTANRLRHSQLEILEELRRTDPEQVDWGDLQASARSKTALVATWRGEIEEPAALLRRAIGWHEDFLARGVERRRDPQRLAKMWVATARLELRRGDLEAAHAAARRALTFKERLWREDFDARWLLGSIFERRGETGVAREEFRQALDTLSDREETRDHTFLSRRALALLALGELDAARSPVYTLLGMGYGHPLFVETYEPFAAQLLPSR